MTCQRRGASHGALAGTVGGARRPQDARSSLSLLSFIFLFVRSRIAYGEYAELGELAWIELLLGVGLMMQYSRGNGESSRRFRRENTQLVLYYSANGTMN